jgi:hypothetical protein
MRERRDRGRRHGGRAGPRFMAVPHHADAEREWAYDRQSHIGRLDEATAKGWTVVDVKCDWSKVFAFEP